MEGKKTHTPSLKSQLSETPTLHLCPKLPVPIQRAGELELSWPSFPSGAAAAFVCLLPLLSDCLGRGNLGIGALRLVPVDVCACMCVSVYVCLNMEWLRCVMGRESWPAWCREFSRASGQMRVSEGTQLHYSWHLEYFASLGHSILSLVYAGCPHSVLSICIE